MERDIGRATRADSETGTDSPFRRWDRRRREAAEEARLHSMPATGGNGVSPRDALYEPQEAALESLDHDAELSLPPGPRRPAAIQTAQWVYRPIEFMEGCRRRFGPVFRVGLGPLRNVVFLSDPSYVKTALTGNPDLLRTGDINGLFRPIIGSNSILVLDGPSHLEQRRLLLPPFHGQALEGFRTVMQMAAEKEVARWPTGERFSTLAPMHRISTDIVLHAILGVRDRKRLARLEELLPRFLDLCQSPAFLMPFLRRDVGGRSSWARLMASVKELDEELVNEIRLRRAESAAGAEPRPDVLSMLVGARHEDGTPMSDKELRDELLTLLVAGHETTSGALALAIDEVVRQPEVIAKLRESTEAGDDTYADAVVREALRRKPVLPIVGRKLSRTARLGAYVLPKGTVLMPCAYLLHHEPAIYPEPHEFRPERFLGGSLDSYAWIPFGGGIRRCVGASFALLQMKVVLQTIFAQFDLTPAGPPERVVRRSVSLAPARGAEVIAETRAV